MKKQVLILGLIVFGILLFKNPFSDKTTIPNFEPYPDSLEYVVPALNLVNGKGINMVRERRTLSPNVAPLYSIILAPVYFLYRDPRAFYITNILLALVGATFFFLAIEEQLRNTWVSGLVFLIYVTNYYIFWFPSLAMADNLVLTLFNIGLFLISSRVSWKNSLLYGLLVMGFLLTKYSAIPLTAIFFVLFLYKILTSQKKKDNLLIFFSTLAVSFVAFYLYELNKGLDIFGVFGQFVNLISNSSTSSSVYQFTTHPDEGFSMRHFLPNLKEYINYLVGSDVSFLWSNIPVIPKWISVGGIVGILWGLDKKRLKFISASLLLLILGSIIFMSTFNPVDARYIYFSIPVLLLGFGLLLIEIKDFMVGRNVAFYFQVIMVGVLLTYLITNGKLLYHQVGSDIKGNQTPWYYESILVLNDYFSIKRDQEPIVVTSVPPYLVDFYSNGNYSLLPLSNKQDFRSSMDQVWGPNNYSDLIGLYKEKLKDGLPVFVGGFGIVNQQPYLSDFQKIQGEFLVTKVADGCFSLCNIYELQLKD